MSILKKYNRHLIKRGFNGPLTFHRPYELGHIVTFDRLSGFEIVGHIEDDFFNLKTFIAKKYSGKAEADIDFGSETGVNIDVKLKGDLQIPNSRLKIDDSGLVISFEKKASYLLKTGDTIVHYIENIAELGKKVKSLYIAKKWNRQWFIISELIEAERATLLISRSGKSKIELKAEGAVQSISENDLVGADIDFSILVKKDMSTSIIGKKGPYFPLFKANGLKVKRLFPSPIGSPFSFINKVNPMNAYTISELEKKDSNFEIAFETHDFREDMFDENDDYLL